MDWGQYASHAQIKMFSASIKSELKIDDVTALNTYSRKDEEHAGVSVTVNPNDFILTLFGSPFSTVTDTTPQADMDTFLVEEVKRLRAIGIEPEDSVYLIDNFSDDFYKAGVWVVDLAWCSQVKALKKENIKNYFMGSGGTQVDGEMLRQYCRYLADYFPKVYLDEGLMSVSSESAFMKYHTSYSSTPQIITDVMSSMGHLKEVLFDKAEIEAVTNALAYPSDMSLNMKISSRSVGVAKVYADVFGIDYGEWYQGVKALQKMTPLERSNLTSMFKKFKDLAKSQNASERAHDMASLLDSASVEKGLMSVKDYDAKHGTADEDEFNQSIEEKVKAKVIDLAKGYITHIAEQKIMKYLKIARPTDPRISEVDDSGAALPSDSSLFKSRIPRDARENPWGHRKPGQTQVRIDPKTGTVPGFSDVVEDQDDERLFG
jgi:hypothetical protein